MKMSIKRGKVEEGCYVEYGKVQEGVVREEGVWRRGMEMVSCTRELKEKCLVRPVEAVRV